MAYIKKKICKLQPKTTMKSLAFLSIIMLASINLFSQALVVSQSELKVDGFRMTSSITPNSLESLIGAPDEKNYGGFSGDLYYSYNKYGLDFGFSEKDGGVYLNYVSARLIKRSGNKEFAYKGYVDLFGYKISKTTPLAEIQANPNITFESRGENTVIGFTSKYGVSIDHVYGSNYSVAIFIN